MVLAEGVGKTPTPTWAPHPDWSSSARFTLHTLTWQTIPANVCKVHRKKFSKRHRWKRILSTALRWWTYVISKSWNWKKHVLRIQRPCCTTWRRCEGGRRLQYCVHRAGIFRVARDSRQRVGQYFTISGCARQANDNIGMDPSDHGGRFLITKKCGMMMSIRYDSSSSITILKIIGQSQRSSDIVRKKCVRIPWTGLQFILFENGGLQVFVWKCYDTQWKDALSLCVRKRYDDGHGLKNTVKLMYFGCEHFDLKESTFVLNQMGCTSREYKQNMKICVCDIFRYDQKVIWKRKMWFRRHDKLLQHGRTERPGIFRRTDKSLMTLCPEKDNQGTMSNDTSHSPVPACCQDWTDCSTGHIWILISRPVRSLQSWSKDLSSVKERSPWYDSSTYWIKKSFLEVILRHFRCEIFTYVMSKDQADEEHICTVALTRTSRKICACPHQISNSFTSSIRDSQSKDSCEKYA